MEGYVRGDKVEKFYKCTESPDALRGKKDGNIKERNATQVIHMYSPPRD